MSEQVADHPGDGIVAQTNRTAMGGWYQQEHAFFEQPPSTAQALEIPPPAHRK